MPSPNNPDAKPRKTRRSGKLKQPISERKLAANRANALRSTGPRSAEGKKTASQNSVRHGILAACSVLQFESVEQFNALSSEYVDYYQPSSSVETCYVEDMVNSYWRLRRLWACETRDLNNTAAEQTEGDLLDKLTSALNELADLPRYETLLRYQNRLQKTRSRALADLKSAHEYHLSLRRAENELESQNKNLPNEPTKGPFYPTQPDDSNQVD